ncbi:MULTISPECIES: hypothetical protein [Bacillus cereus group]
MIPASLQFVNGTVFINGKRFIHIAPRHIQNYFWTYIW